MGGLDPTNQLVGGERHIRVALGRDYADVAPTRGVYKGEAESTLSVIVTVAPVNSSAPEELPPPTVIRFKPPTSGPGIPTRTTTAIASATASHGREVTPHA